MLSVGAGTDVVTADHLAEGSAALREAKVDIVKGIPAMKVEEAV